MNYLSCLKIILYLQRISSWLRAEAGAGAIPQPSLPRRISSSLRPKLSAPATFSGLQVLVCCRRQQGSTKSRTPQIPLPDATPRGSAGHGCAPRSLLLHGPSQGQTGSRSRPASSLPLTSSGPRTLFLTSLEPLFSFLDNKRDLDHAPQLYSAPW